MKEIINSGQLNVENKANEIAFGKQKMLDERQEMIDNFLSEPVKLLKLINLTIELNDELDEQVKQQIRENADKILILKPEQVKEELLIMAQSGKKLRKAVELMSELGILGLILPEIEILKTFMHNQIDHPEGDNVFEHLLATLEQGGELVWGNMGVLFHDIGKAKTYQWRENKGHTYYDHDLAGAQMFRPLGERLGLTEEEIATMEYVIAYHMKFKIMDIMKKSKVKKFVNHPDFEILKYVAECDEKARGEKFDELDFGRRLARAESIIGEKKEQV